MWLWVSMMGLALSVSMDSLSVGISYGMRGIRFPFLSLTLISLTSGVVVFASMHIGEWLALLLPRQVERGLASVILIGLGGWAVYHVYRPKEERREGLAEDGGSAVAGRLNGAVQVLKRPEQGDLDRSGTISQKEALLIGLALSTDAFGAGISSSLLHLPALSFALLVGLFTLALIRAGLSLGRLASKTKIMKKANVVPGFVLIVLGVVKLFR
ncbi:sporulation membrane protein YtaF [Caldibacillus thermoamylovorans]